MPSIADITVKKADNTTDVVYGQTVPASGENNPAIWRASGGVSSPALAPEFRLTARDADGGKKRALRATYVYPQAVTSADTGITSVRNRAVASADWTFSKEMTQAGINEFAAQFANLLASALVKGCVNSGYSAT